MTECALHWWSQKNGLHANAHLQKCVGEVGAIHQVTIDSTVLSLAEVCRGGGGGSGDCIDSTVLSLDYILLMAAV